MKKRSIVLLIGLAVSGCLASGVAQEQIASGEGEKTAGQAYKNIQALRDLPASEVDGVMSFMSAALGVNCAYCHASDWASDEKSAKLATRRMIAMTQAMNKEYFGANPAVTCYTCHRGRHNTEPLPPASLATPPEGATDASGNRVSPLPSADQVVARYTRAIGGEAAIEKLATRVLRGIETTFDGMNPPRSLEIEIAQAAPDRLLITRRVSSSVTRQGFDGLKAWTSRRDPTEAELTELKREAKFFRYLRIKDSYQQMRVLAREEIRGRQVYAVGAVSPENSRERLYFEVGSGLLIRRYVAFRTAFGSIPEVTDFDAYREVAGVKWPLRITWSRAPFWAIRTVTEVRINEPIEAARFAPPDK